MYKYLFVTPHIFTVKTYVARLIFAEKKIMSVYQRIACTFKCKLHNNHLQ